MKLKQVYENVAGRICTTIPGHQASVETWTTMGLKRKLHASKIPKPFWVAKHHLRSIHLFTDYKISFCSFWLPSVFWLWRVDRRCLQSFSWQKRCGTPDVIALFGMQSISFGLCFRKHFSWLLEDKKGRKSYFFFHSTHLRSGKVSRSRKQRVPTTATILRWELLPKWIVTLYNISLIINCTLVFWTIIACLSLERDTSCLKLDGSVKHNTWHKRSRYIREKRSTLPDNVQEMKQAAPWCCFLGCPYPERVNMDMLYKTWRKNIRRRIRQLDSSWFWPMPRRCMYSC